MSANFEMHQIGLIIKPWLINSLPRLFSLCKAMTTTENRMMNIANIISTKKHETVQYFPAQVFVTSVTHFVFIYISDNLPPIVLNNF